MIGKNEWGDEVALHLACNVLQVDIVIIPAFRESAVNQGLGLTVITALDKPARDPLYLFAFSESDFSPAHYQSIRPRSQEGNVIHTFLQANEFSRTPSIHHQTQRAVNLTDVPPSFDLTEESLESVPFVVELEQPIQSYQVVVRSVEDSLR